MPTGFSKKTGKNPFRGKKRKPFTEEHRRKISLAAMGRSPWNKGVTGHKHSEKTKALMRTQRQDHLHPNWLGDMVGYSALHRWVSRKLGKAKTHPCKECGVLGDSQWANLDGKYSRNLETWGALCRRCHYHYDERVLGIRHGYNRK